jgi:hypothetical protein
MTVDTNKTLIDANEAEKMARENEYKEIDMVLKIIYKEATEGHHKVVIPGKLNEATIFALRDKLFEVETQGGGFGAITRIYFKRRPAIGQVRRPSWWQDIAAMQFLALIGWVTALVIAGILATKMHEFNLLIKANQEIHGTK